MATVESEGTLASEDSNSTKRSCTHRFAGWVAKKTSLTILFCLIMKTLIALPQNAHGSLIGKNSRRFRKYFPVIHLSQIAPTGCKAGIQM